MPRCRLSETGLKILRSPVHHRREGNLLGHNSDGLAIVLWDGNKTTATYHPDFIEILREPDPEGGT